MSQHEASAGAYAAAFRQFLIYCTKQPINRRVVNKHTVFGIKIFMHVLLCKRVLGVGIFLDAQTED